MPNQNALPDAGFVRLSSIIAPSGPIPVSKSTWWQGVKDGRFPKLGSLRGLCPTCTGMMHRRTSVGRIKAAAGDLRVSIRLAEPRLIEMTKPCSNPHSEGA